MTDTAVDPQQTALIRSLARLAKLRNTLGELVPIDTSDPNRPVAQAATGRLTVAPGQTIASAWGNTVFDQSVLVFASPADRDAQWPTPHDGSMCFTSDMGIFWVRRAGGWSIMGPTVAGRMKQNGTDAISTSAWSQILHMAADYTVGNGWQVTNGALIVPVTGRYRVTYGLGVNGSSNGALASGMIQLGVRIGSMGGALALGMMFTIGGTCYPLLCGVGELALTAGQGLILSALSTVTCFSDPANGPKIPSWVAADLITG